MSMSKYASRTDYDKTQKEMTSMENLMYSKTYTKYVMAHNDRPCYNDDVLLELMEEDYLFEEFYTEWLKGDRNG